MGNCNINFKLLFNSLSWGDPELGKLGHQKKELTEEEKK
jgi:hypothetical protein